MLSPCSILVSVEATLERELSRAPYSSSIPSLALFLVTALVTLTLSFSGFPATFSYWKLHYMRTALPTTARPEKHTRKHVDDYLHTSLLDMCWDALGYSCPALKVIFLKLDLAHPASCPAQGPGSSSTANTGADFPGTCMQDGLPCGQFEGKEGPR